MGNQKQAEKGLYGGERHLPAGKRESSDIRRLVDFTSRIRILCYTIMQLILIFTKWSSIS